MDGKALGDRVQAPFTPSCLLRHALPQTDPASRDWKGLAWFGLRQGLPDEATWGEECSLKSVANPGNSRNIQSIKYKVKRREGRGKEAGEFKCGCFLRCLSGCSELVPAINKIVAEELLGILVFVCGGHIKQSTDKESSS
jgi:hypothetical protein